MSRQRERIITNNNNGKYENAHRADTADITRTRTRSVGLDGGGRSSVYCKLPSENEHRGGNEWRNIVELLKFYQFWLLFSFFFFLWVARGGRKSQAVSKHTAGENAYGVQWSHIGRDDCLRFSAERRGPRGLLDCKSTGLTIYGYR